MPGVVKRDPRVFRKVSNGVTAAVVATMAGVPPSQLISRRPTRSGPGLLLFTGTPRAARKASTVLWIEAAFGPAAWKTAGVGPATGWLLSARAGWLIASAESASASAAWLNRRIAEMTPKAPVTTELFFNLIVCMVLLS